MCLAQGGGPALAALPFIGAGMAAYGANYEGRAKRKYYEYLAAGSEQQAALVEKAGEEQASLFQDEAARATKAVKQEGDKTLATQKTVMATNGVGPGSATAEDLTRDTISKEKLDEMAIRYSADSKAYATKKAAAFQAADLRNQADQYRRAGKNAFDEGILGTYTSLLSGASSVASNYGRSRGGA